MMMELFLSSDGKHTVHVATETAREMKRLLPSAKRFYESIVNTYGTKAQMWQRAVNGNGAIRKVIVPEPEAPLCPVHKTPMRYRQGRYGAFWSCPTRLDDGNWCDCTIDARQS